MIEFKDEELLLRLKNFEDNFVERKTSGDSKDWLKTIVAFANSTPLGYPAVLYIGVKDDGTPEEKTVNLDSLQKTFVEKVRDHYPPIYYVTKVLEIDGHQFLAVLVPGSPDRPHFAGPAFVRKGSKTVEASGEQFADLIAMRNSKVYEILKWKGRTVTIAFVKSSASPRLGTATSTYVDEGTVQDCTQFYVTLDYHARSWSYPLSRVDISFDNKANRLQLLVFEH